MGQECAHCGNTLGFTLATCGACGWNEEDACFRWIRVWDPQDPVQTAEHANRTRDSLRSHTRPEPEPLGDVELERASALADKLSA